MQKILFIILSVYLSALADAFGAEQQQKTELQLQRIIGAMTAERIIAEEYSERTKPLREDRALLAKEMDLKIRVAQSLGVTDVTKIKDYYTMKVNKSTPRERGFE